jgi:hypothetical protein
LGSHAWATADRAKGTGKRRIIRFFAAWWRGLVRIIAVDHRFVTSSRFL